MDAASSPVKPPPPTKTSWPWSRSTTVPPPPSSPSANPPKSSILFLLILFNHFHSTLLSFSLCLVHSQFPHELSPATHRSQEIAELNSQTRQGQEKVELLEPKYAFLVHKVVFFRSGNKNNFCPFSKFCEKITSEWKKNPQSCLRMGKNPTKLPSLSHNFAPFYFFCFSLRLLVRQQACHRRRRRFPWSRREDPLCLPRYLTRRTLWPLESIGWRFNGD